MDMLQGHQLLNGQRQVFAAQEALDEVDIICYYFSAHWCPPCRQFTPVLADFYKVIFKNVWMDHGICCQSKNCTSRRERSHRDGWMTALQTKGL